MLICAVAERLEAPIFTLDRDFEHYRDILGTELYES
jgi:predicted nucleic acid-binding protein